MLLVCGLTFEHPNRPSAIRIKQGDTEVIRRGLLADLEMDNIVCGVLSGTHLLSDRQRILRSRRMTAQVSTEVLSPSPR